MTQRKKIENTEQYSRTAQLPRNTQNFRTKQLSTAASIRCECKVITLIYTYHQSRVYMLRIYKNPTFSRVLQGKKAHNGISGVNTSFMSRQGVLTDRFILIIIYWPLLLSILPLHRTLDYRIRSHKPVSKNNGG